jgi:hypothetical protein
MLRKSIAILVICTALALAALAGRASASNAAFVVNHGQQVGDNCVATVGTAVYTGYITHLVITPSGNFNLGCQLWGPSVPRTMDFNGLRIDPKGHAVLSENGA